MLLDTLCASCADGDKVMVACDEADEGIFAAAVQAAAASRSTVLAVMANDGDFGCLRVPRALVRYMFCVCASTPTPLHNP